MRRREGLAVAANQAADPIAKAEWMMWKLMRNVN
jgi:hypothetical protein